MIRTVSRRLRRYAPAASYVFLLLAIVAAVLHVLCMRSVAVADFLNEHVAAFFRAGMNALSVWIPFSLAETLILALPVIFVACLVVCVRHAGKGWRRAMYCVNTMLSVVALLYAMFVFTFAPGYHASSLTGKLGIETRKVSALELAETAAILADATHSTLDEITFRYGDASVMPYSVDELSRRLMDAYDRVTEVYPFLQEMDSRVKPVALSEPWTYTHISGAYTMFTGEANLNVNYPDYVLPYTAAHELAHQRGIARENEANFVAFLVCAASDDPYIRYSGYLNLYEYVASALYSASKDYYSMIASSLDMRIRYEMQSYNRFFDRYRDTVVADVSEAVNNTYLVIQGTEGTKSYGMVVDLAVAYFLPES